MTNENEIEKKDENTPADYRSEEGLPENNNESGTESTPGEQRSEGEGEGNDLADDVAEEAREATETQPQNERPENPDRSNSGEGPSNGGIA